MTSQGHPHAIFRRALERRDPLGAWSAAADMPALGLPESLALVLLLAHDDRVNRFQVASARWTARYALERRATIHDTALIAAQFVAMQTGARRDAIRTLADHFQARAQRELAGVARAWS